MLQNFFLRDRKVPPPPIEDKRSAEDFLTLFLLTQLFPPGPFGREGGDGQTGDKSGEGDDRGKGQSEKFHRRIPFRRVWLQGCHLKNENEHQQKIKTAPDSPRDEPLFPSRIFGVMNGHPHINAGKRRNKHDDDMQKRDRKVHSHESKKRQNNNGQPEKQSIDEK